MKSARLAVLVHPYKPAEQPPFTAHRAFQPHAARKCLSDRIRRLHIHGGLLCLDQIFKKIAEADPGSPELQLEFLRHLKQLQWIAIRVTGKAFHTG